MKKLSYLLFLFLLVSACDKCKDVTCVNGTCVDGTCECFAGFTGSSCEIDMCASVNCDHGDCVAGICNCDENYEGTLCDEIIDPCFEVDCGDHGECDDDGECECDDGWTGDECDEEIVTEESAIAVWTAIVSFPCNTSVIDVYIDDDYEGYLDGYCTSEPNCGDAATVTTIVTPGVHSISAECNDGETCWGDEYCDPVDFEVGEGECLLIELTYGKGLVVSSTRRWIP